MATKSACPGDPGLTALGREQAARVGRRLSGLGVRALWSSPMRRARETADCIAAVTGLAVQPDARLRERLNWDDGMPFDDFLALWARTMHDRDLVPEGGQSSRQAAARLLAFVAGLSGLPGPVAAVTHGGVTTELLRGLLGDDALRPRCAGRGCPAVRHHRHRRPESGHDRLGVAPGVSAAPVVAVPHLTCSTTMLPAA